MDLPFPDQSFDVVFCLEAAHCVIDKRRFLREAHRVLRRGKLLLADIVGTTHLPLVNWQPALKLNLVRASDWERMLATAPRDVPGISLLSIGSAVVEPLTAQRVCIGQRQ